jgi:hypothetical protein
MLESTDRGSKHSLSMPRKAQKGFETGSRLAKKFSTEVKDKVSIC